MLNKRGAFELSIGTLVVLVIGLTMLILGIVLVTNIFGGATDSVDTINEKVKNEITTLFSDASKDVIVRLGSGNTARVKAGSESFGIAIGAKTKDGSSTDRDRLKYKLTLDSTTSNNCVRLLGQSRAEGLFITSLNTENNFDEFDGSNAFAIVQLKIPDGTAECTQKVFVDVKDSKTNENVGGSFFIIDIISGGFFG